MPTTLDQMTSPSVFYDTIYQKMPRMKSKFGIRIEQFPD